MQQDGQSAKQLVSERVKSATNILVTVSSNPSVDALSAALGLTLLLNKLDKHATAVFSGQLPPAITFLEPDKTFENTVDSLRDFIIALDKEKADRLRYKVEDDVVRIFITPYRTTITSDDLQFSQGDFNVELILALGVEKREDLDTAITAHNRVLHDATVVTINAGDQTSSLGAVDWHEPSASSLCEMLVSISESFGSGLLDQQIANALLTGIVAATERFSNQRTSPKVMTMAAQLMAAGANQQLIATKLEEGHELPPSQPPAKDGSSTLPEGTSQKLSKADKEEPAKKKAADGEMQITHDEAADAEAAAPAGPSLPPPVVTPPPADHEEQLNQQLEAAAPVAPPPAAPTLDDLKAEYEETPEPSMHPGGQPTWRERRIEPPSMGGTLNATSEQALKDKQRDEQEERNHTLLSHDNSAPPPPAFNNYSQEPREDAVLSDITAPSSPPPLPGTASVPPPPPPALPPIAPPPTPAVPPTSGHQQTLAELEEQTHAHHAAAEEAAAVAQPADAVKNDVESARAAVTNALNDIAFEPAHNPSKNMGTQPLGTINHAADVLPPPPPAPAPDFTMPPLPDMSTLPPLPPELSAPVPVPPPLSDTPAVPDQPTEQTPPPPNDPGQYHIPGQ